MLKAIRRAGVDKSILRDMDGAAAIAPRPSALSRPWRTHKHHQVRDSDRRIAIHPRSPLAQAQGPFLPEASILSPAHFALRAPEWREAGALLRSTRPVPAEAGRPI